MLIPRFAWLVVTVSVESLVLVAAAAAAAPLAASVLSRWVSVPVVVFEIVFGILLGPQVAGGITVDHYVEFLADLGLAMLFFLAGYEVDFAGIRGRPLRRAAWGWLLSLTVGVALGIGLAPSATAGVMVGICLTSTALGTILPVLRDAGELDSAVGKSVIAVGTVGEFGPLIAVALFLGGRSPARSSAVLVGFAVLIGVSLIVAVRFEHTRMHRLIGRTLHTSGQFAVRLVIVVIAGLVALATALGLDVLLGAFAAGVLIKLLLEGTDPAAVEVIEAKIDAVGFGFLVPFFFVNTGVQFDLDAIIHDAHAALLVVVFLMLFLVVRGIPASLAAPPDSQWRNRLGIALFGATGLPIIVAVTAIGVDQGALSAATASELIGAGMLSVLAFPAVAVALTRSG